MFGMGGALPPVVAHLVGDITEFSAAMGKAGAEVQAMASRGEARLARMAHIGKAALLGLVGAALILGGASVAMASKFDAAMEQVHTQAGASQREVDALKGKVLDLAGATGQGPEKLAEALFHVESVGYRGAAAMSVLTEASKLATISGASLDETTYGLTSVMQTFGAKAQDAAKWAAFFNGVVGTGDMRMEAFNRAVGTGYFSAAQTFGVSAQSAGAALAFITDRGAHADEAATRLRMTLALMAAPSQKAATLLRAVGLSGGEVKASTEAMTKALQKSHLTTVALASDLKKPDGLYVALHHLQSALKASGLSAEAANALLSHAFGGGKSDSTILAMLNNLDTLKSKYDALGHNVKTYNESWAATTQQFSVKVKRLEASAEALGIKLGNVLIPKIESLVSWLMKAGSWMAKHKALTEGLAVAIGGALLVAMGAYIVTLGIAAAEMIVATWPILLIIAAVALLVAGIIWLKNHWGQVWGWISSKTNEAADGIRNAWDHVKKWTEDKWHAVENAIRGAWNRVTSWLSSVWHKATDPIVHGWEWLVAKTTAVWNRIHAFFAKWWPLLLVIFAPWLALLIGLWNHFHEKVWNGAVKVWNRLTGWLSAKWAEVKKGAQVTWDAIYTHIVHPLERAWSWVTARVSQGVSWLRARFNVARADTAAVWNRIYDAIAGPIGRAYQWVVTKVGQIRDKLVAGIQQARSWLSGVGSWFSSIGSSIVDGIVSGVEWAGGRLLHTMGNLANQALNAAKSALGINSPSKVFAAVVGHAIPEGVAHGVMNRAHVAVSAVRAFVNRLPGSASPGMALASAAAGMGGGATVLELHLTTEAQLDGDVLFRSTQRRAVRYEKRNGKAPFSTTGAATA